MYSGFIFVGPFFEMTPDVEVRRAGVRSGDFDGYLVRVPREMSRPPPPKALLQPLERRSGCMSGSTILLQPLLYGCS